MYIICILWTGQWNPRITDRWILRALAAMKSLNPMTFVANFYSCVQEQPTMACHRQYTIPHKLAILQEFARLQDEEGLPLWAAARRLGVDDSKLYWWAKETESFNQFIAPPGNQMKRQAVNRAARSFHPGHKSCLSIIEEELLLFIFKHCEQGMSVSIQMALQSENIACSTSFLFP